MNQKALLKIIIIITILLATGSGVGYTYYNHQTAALENTLHNLEAINTELSQQNQQLKHQLRLLKQKQSKLHPHQEDLDWNSPNRPPDRKYAGGSGPTAYLTFDDGPSKNTLAILDILARYRIAATFFVTGNNYSGDPLVYRRIVEAGHAIGNHTYTHNFRFIYRSPEHFMRDFIRLEDFLYEQTGVRTNIARLPGGSNNTVAAKVAGYRVMPGIIKEVTARGYDCFDWNAYAGDGREIPTKRAIVRNVLGSARPERGDIVILFHDTHKNGTTVEALPEIIDALIDRGYYFEPLTAGVVNVKFR